MAGGIVVGYDGMEGAAAALSTSVSIAAAFRCPLVIVFGYRPAPIGGDVPTMARAVREVGEQMTDEALAVVKAQDPAVEATVELVDDRPADAILRAADEHDALAIVVGATNKGPIAGGLLGSVTYQVVHRSTRPVVVVPARDEGDG
ncbi:MAG TPA: universal stress protein [Acidimicrobiia bacterium]|nr:universal stress protein [Acidimicrobiia bacterium]